MPKTYSGIESNICLIPVQTGFLYFKHENHKNRDSAYDNAYSRMH